MKKIFLLFTIITTICLFTSCWWIIGSPPPDGPSVKVTSDLLTPKDTIVFDRTKTTKEVTFTIILTPDIFNNQEIAKLNIKQSELKINYDTIFISPGSREITLTKTFTIPQPANDAVIKYLFTFTTSYEIGFEADSVYYIYATTKSLIPDAIFENKAVRLEYNNGSVNGYNSSTPFLYLTKTIAKAVGPTANDSEIDAALAYQSSYGIVLGSPDAKWIGIMYNFNVIDYYSIIGKNNTKLMKTDLNYATATPAEIKNINIISSYIGGIDSLGQGVDNISVGDIIAFETQAGMKGLIKITSNAKYRATITSDVKIFIPGQAGK